MYNKTIIRFGFCDIRNNQGRGNCYPASANNTYNTETLIIPDIAKTSYQPRTQVGHSRLLSWIGRGRLHAWTEFPPKINDEFAQREKRAIFLSLIWGGGERGGLSVPLVWDFPRLCGLDTLIKFIIIIIKVGTGQPKCCFKKQFVVLISLRCI